MTRRQCHPFRFFEVRKPVFDVIILVEIADKSNCLFPRAEGPVTWSLWKDRSQRMFRWLHQGSGMTGSSVSGELRWMTSLALFTSCILAFRPAGQKQQKQK
jgi:hypothetical protein